jgi:hypothetical protein
MAEIDALKKAHVCRRLIKKCFFFFDTNWKNALQGKYKYKLVRGTSLGEQHTSQTTKVWSPRYVVRLFPFPTIFGTQSMMRTSCFLKTCEEFLFSYGHFCNHLFPFYFTIVFKSLPHTLACKLHVQLLKITSFLSNHMHHIVTSLSKV